MVLARQPEQHEKNAQLFITITSLEPGLFYKSGNYFIFAWFVVYVLVNHVLVNHALPCSEPIGDEENYKIFIIVSSH